MAFRCARTYIEVLTGFTHTRTGVIYIPGGNSRWDLHGYYGHRCIQLLLGTLNKPTLTLLTGLQYCLTFIPQELNVCIVNYP